jgi:predicted permease
MYSRGPNSIQILKKLFFPPFITFVVACLMNVFNFDFQEWIQFILQKVGSGVTPLALVSVGLQLRFESRSQHWQFWGLGCIS